MQTETFPKRYETYQNLSKTWQIETMLYARPMYIHRQGMKKSRRKALGAYNTHQSKQNILINMDPKAINFRVIRRFCR